MKKTYSVLLVTLAACMVCGLTAAGADKDSKERKRWFFFSRESVRKESVRGYRVEGAELPDFDGLYCEAPGDAGRPKYVKKDDPGYVLLYLDEGPEQRYWVFERRGGGEFYSATTGWTPPATGFIHRESGKPSALTLTETPCEEE